MLQCGTRYGEEKLWGDMSEVLLGLELQYWFWGFCWIGAPSCSVSVFLVEDGSLFAWAKRCNLALVFPAYWRYSCHFPQRFLFYGGLFVVVLFGFLATVHTLVIIQMMLPVSAKLQCCFCQNLAAAVCSSEWCEWWLIVHIWSFWNRFSTFLSVLEFKFQLESRPELN